LATVSNLAIIGTGIGLSNFFFAEYLFGVTNRLLVMLTVMLCGFVPSVPAASAKIQKVLPHLLDEKGRHTIYPSLFERDFYQAELRKNPTKCSGIRFDIHWKARQFSGHPATVRLEVRGVNTPPRQLETFSHTVSAGGWLGKWSQLRIDGKDFARLGQIRAWRVTLWDGETQLAEQKSFLW
jgi:hypothetical protein